jgi:AraC-like DNA-binding protein
MVRRVGELSDLETLQRLGRARDFIDHCYDHPLSLDQISEKACFSRYHFLRLFRQASTRLRTSTSSTFDASHNDIAIESILKAFRVARHDIVNRLESFDADIFARAAIHPRNAIGGYVIFPSGTRRLPSRRNQ